MTQVSNNVGIVLVPVEAITSRVSIRSVKRAGVERLKISMRKFGFLPQHALLVTREADGTYELEDGNHRLDAAIELGITEVPVHILEGHLSDNDKKRIARESNEVAGTLVLTTLVDEAEFVWRERGLGKSLFEIADILDWSVPKVKQYSALSGVTKDAWKMIATALENNERALNEESDEKVTIVTFSEGLLRCILNLTAEQQIELVKGLISGEITKGQFRTLASNYRASNDVKTYVAENPDVVSVAAYEGLTPYVVQELENKDTSFEDIAAIAKWTREFKSEIKYCASKALHIGSWMLGCAEGEGDNDPPYAQEQLESEGRKMWCLVPKDIPNFLEIGKLERSLHEVEESKGKKFSDVKDEDMLSTCTQDTIKWLADSFTRVMFRSCGTMWHYRTLGMSAEQKEKFLKGEQVDPHDDLEFGDLEFEEERIKRLIEERRAGRGDLPRIAIEIGLRLSRVKAMFDYAELIKKDSPQLAEIALKRGHIYRALQEKLTSEEFEHWLVARGAISSEVHEVLMPLVEKLISYAQRYEKETSIDSIDDDTRFEMACVEVDFYHSFKKAS